MPELLFEIGTEELPAGYLEPALRELAEQLRSRLRELQLESRKLSCAGTPRRMTVAAEGIPASQPPRTVRTVGPPAHVAFDEDGNATAAAQGFARSKDISVTDLQVEETEKGPYVVAVQEEEGQRAADVLPGLLEEVAAALTFPKSMRWEESDFTFARPIRWLVALLDEEVLPVSLAGIEAGRTTPGHPFLAPGGCELAGASYPAYRDALREHYVMVDVEERRGSVRSQINALLEPHGSRLRDEALLQEVTNLVQWPHAVEGSFDEEFLRMPAAIVVAAMKEHQRYFPVRDGRGRLMPRFITVSDRTAEQDELVREGNERVLRARLDDARFYWEEDRRTSMEELVPRLKDVVFLGGLGDNLQRTERLVELAPRIAEQAGDATAAERVRRAARLCKADLLTGLVGEFPGLQGIVGRELALAEGEDETVAQAIGEHYRPAGADDPVPESLEGACLALADRLDVIAGCFSLGLLPKGSQDPYALRRNAMGTLLIIEHRGLDLHLGELLEMTRRVAAEHGIECSEETLGLIREFFRDRLYHTALERGYSHDFVRAVLAAGYDDVKQFWARLDALSECSTREWWPDLVELVDRTYRIQKGSEGAGSVEESLLEEPLEKELAATLQQHGETVGRLFAEGAYVRAAETYCSTFAQLVHDFFEEVFVNVEDRDVRRNRKALCGQVYHLFADQFADLYLIETAEVEEA